MKKIHLDDEETLVIDFDDDQGLIRMEIQHPEFDTVGVYLTRAQALLLRNGIYHEVGCMNAFEKGKKARS